MYRKFIATITAASIALTAIGAAPAFANDQQTARTIAAIIGLAAVGAIIHENRKDRKQKEADYERYTPKPIYEQPSRNYQPPVYNQPKPRPLPQRAQRKLLPQECFRSLETRRGKVRMFGARCLNRNYDFSQSLPRQCEYTFNTKRGDRRGYEARCLRDRGYRLARG